MPTYSFPGNKIGQIAKYPSLANFPPQGGQDTIYIDIATNVAYHYTDNYYVFGGGNIFNGYGTTNNWTDTNNFTNVTVSGTLIGATNLVYTSGNQSIGGVKKFTGGTKHSFTSTGLEFYNTSDETVNFERVRHFWSGNTYNINVDVAGTGVQRPISIFGNTTQLRIGDSSPNIGFANIMRGTSAAGFSTFGILGTYTNSSGINNGLAILNTFNQSDTAGYRGIWVSPFEQTVGSGEKLLLDLGTNSAANGGGTHTSRFKVFNNGIIETIGSKIFSTGNFFIGSTPVDAGFQLDVAGTSRIQGQLTTTVDAIINGARVGLGAGNIATNLVVGATALITNTTGDSNSGFGVNALRYNTTGASNSAFGATALRYNTTGVYNSGFGVSALLNNTTGAYNSAFGLNALWNNTTGVYNSAFGVNALLNNTTGGSNSAFGVNAGRYISDGTTANSITTNSIFIGTDTKAQANSQTNQIVIGHGVTGLGSNTTVLGNSSTTRTQLFGRLTIGALTQYADNTAAIAGGLIAGDLYRTATNGVQIVV